MDDLLFASLRTIDQLLTAGVAITAFSLLLYALTFNLRDRVARSFAGILACVTIVFVGEALSSAVSTPAEIQFWLQINWIGVIYLPAAYFHASDALLATTGRPSRGRRYLVVRLGYLLSTVFLGLLPFGLLLGPLHLSDGPAPYLQPTSLTWLFSLYYGGMILWAWVNFWRAFRRTYATTSRRRMLYLMAGATAPALGSFPYMLVGAAVAADHPVLFWLAVLGSNLLVTVLLVMMAYAVAFFGVAWPDRVVKSRLFKWLMRGPVTASSVLAITTLTRRVGEQFGLPYGAAVPILMVGTILVFQLAISLFAPLWERWLFYDGDQEDLRALQNLENRLLTTGDLRQFLEAVLAAVCDRLQSPLAFIAALDQNSLELVVTVGDRKLLEGQPLSEDLLQHVSENGHTPQMFTWGPYWLLSLVVEEDDQRHLVGLLGVQHPASQALDEEQSEALTLLAHRAAQALHDRLVQRQLLASLRNLAPQVDMIQRLRAAARYGVPSALADPANSEQAEVAAVEQTRLIRPVKDALTDYWGGPRLTDSPLLRLQIVQREIEEGENPTNALRAILRQAIEAVRPQGERRFTGEWILYNILEMKFMEGRKVREIAARLAMSEADFYRKQRIAIDEVARIITEMENNLLAQHPVAQTNGQVNSKEPDATQVGSVHSSSPEV